MHSYARGDPELRRSQEAGSSSARLRPLPPKPLLSSLPGCFGLGSPKNSQSHWRECLELRLLGTPFFPESKSHSNYPIAFTLASLKLSLHNPPPASTRPGLFSGLVVIEGEDRSSGFSVSSVPHKRGIRAACDRCLPGAVIIPWVPRSPQREGRFQGSTGCRQTQQIPFFFFF